MRLAFNFITEDGEPLDLINKDTGTKIWDCYFADDETGEYAIFDTCTVDEMLQRGDEFTTKVIDGVVRCVPTVRKVDENKEPITLDKKGNIEFRKRDGSVYSLDMSIEDAHYKKAVESFLQERNAS